MTANTNEDKLTTLVAGLLASGDYTYYDGLIDKTYFVTDGHKKQVMLHATELLLDIKNNEKVLTEVKRLR
tara:strand:- start:1924 stop:2133 length:210 start_codon:yes stop_codon:yes gene_type:complete